jgi:cell wall-associated NlpC family hydrolase
VGDAIRAQFIRSAAVRYAWEFLGLPYRWGGDDPVHGFDCSGLVVEVLQGVGLLPHKSDMTANGLYLRYANKVVARGYAGCLCLWFDMAGLATHVEICVDEFHTIGASGGGSATTSDDAAAAQNAFIKMRPLGYRGTNYKLVDPFLEAS